MSVEQKIARLRSIPNQKWALHEVPVCQKLGIKCTEAKSESEELSGFLKVLANGGKGSKREKTFEPTKYGPIDLKDANNEWNISYVGYGAREEFPTSKLSSNKRVKRQPRYFSFGKNGVPIATQLALVDAVKGEARGLDSTVAARRSSSWLQWYNGAESKNALQFREVYLPVIARQFGSVWNVTIDPNSTRISKRVLEGIEEEIGHALRACNCVASSWAKDLLESPQQKRQRVKSPAKARRITPKEREMPAELLLPTNEQLQQPQSEETNQTETVTELPGPLKLKVMRKLCDDGQLEELAAIEYAVFLVAAHGVDTYDEIISDLKCAKYREPKTIRLATIARLGRRTGQECLEECRVCS